ncbi:MAG: ROK family protein [Patescibacteria group bacterium]|nr:ROK family protein [Patescibacteria group bacterium]
MKNFIGIDVGGTKITGVVFDGKRILDRLTIVTPRSLFEFERNLRKLADFLSANRQIAGVGIGMAGLIDARRGLVVYSPNIKYIKNLPLARRLQRAGLGPVRIDNDANCFTRAEMRLGQGKAFKNFLALTLGTGIGGGIVIDRNIYRGRGGGGELGHIVLDGQFWETAFQKARDQKDDQKLARLTGWALASLTNALEPDAVIIGGGVATDHGRHFWPGAKKEMKKFLFNPESKTKVLISKLKDAGALGAALLWI